MIKTFDLPEDAELGSENINTNNNNHSKQNRSTSSSPIPNNSQEKNQQNHSDSNESSESKFKTSTSAQESLSSTPEKIPHKDCPPISLPGPLAEATSLQSGTHKTMSLLLHAEKPPVEPKISADLINGVGKSSEGVQTVNQAAMEGASNVPKKIKNFEEMSDRSRFIANLLIGDNQTKSTNNDNLAANKKSSSNNEEKDSTNHIDITSYFKKSNSIKTFIDSKAENDELVMNGNSHIDNTSMLRNQVQEIIEIDHVILQNKISLPI